MTVLNLLDRELIVVWTGKGNDINKPGHARWEYYEKIYVTGISPQSTISRPELKGLTPSGTLYPPYRVKRRDPARIPAALHALLG